MKVVHNYNDLKVIIEFIDYCNINEKEEKHCKKKKKSEINLC